LKRFDGKAAFFGLECRVDDLVLLVHVGTEFRTGLWLVELEWDGLCWGDTLLSLLHLSDESFLELAEVWN